MSGWEVFKKSFNAWEGQTSRLLETWLQSPLILTRAGAAISTVMKAKTLRDKAVAELWSSVGLPTRRDQERTLAALHRLEGRILELEAKVSEQTQPTPKAAPKHLASQPTTAPR